MDWTLSIRHRNYWFVRSYVYTFQKNRVLSTEGLEFYDRVHFEGYRIPSKEKVWTEMDFCDSVNVIFFFALYNIDPNHIYDLRFGLNLVNERVYIKKASDERLHPDVDAAIEKIYGIYANGRE